MHIYFLSNNNLENSTYLQNKISTWLKEIQEISYNDLTIVLILSTLRGFFSKKK